MAVVAQTDERVLRRGREGSRWYNVRPTSDEVAAWFATIPLHEGMQHEHYIGGVTLIQTKEKSEEVTGFDDDGLPIFKERQDAVYVPYVKVETRVAYFWQLMEKRDWKGEILPVPSPGEPVGLPAGFFRYSATKPDQKIVTFVGCSMRVHVTERSRTTTDGRSVMTPPPGSKIVPTATRWDVDPNALMKAETGAIGRALGVAGMLVVPGSGVATAEDMLEALSGPPPGATEPQLPTPAAAEAPKTDEQLRALVGELATELGELNGRALEDYQTWARGRGLKLDTAQGAVLRGAVRKLETLVEQAREAAASA
jgi:hypothetical protein